MLTLIITIVSFFIMRSAYLWLKAIYLFARMLLVTWWIKNKATHTEIDNFIHKEILKKSEDYKKHEKEFNALVDEVLKD